MATHSSRLLLTTRPFFYLERSHYSKTLLPIFAFSTTALYKANPLSKTKTFSHIYQECSSQALLSPGKQAHARMIVSGFVPTTFVTNCLIQMYLKSASLDYACKTFDKMLERDVVSYNAMISGYASCGKMGVAVELFDRMPERDVVSWNSLISGFLLNGECWNCVSVFLEMGRSGVRFDRRTFAVVLKACASLEESGLGVQLHGIAVRLGFDDDVVVGSALLDMYAKCKRLDYSFQVFSQIPEKNWVSWSAIIAGCISNYRYVEGFKLFKEILKAGVGVSQSIYASFFRCCADLGVLNLGTQLHGHAVISNFGSDVIVGTAILDMYAKCGNIKGARKLFNSLPKHRLQSYNAIIVGYGRNGHGIEALQLFRRLQSLGLDFDAITLSGLLGACASTRRDLEGLQVQGLAVKSGFMSNICVANAILDMYGKCGGIVEAFCMFDEMERRDAVSWNALIAACEQNGGDEETLHFYSLMLQSGLEPDEFTYGSVLKACSGRQALNTGMEIHNRIIKSGLGSNSFVGGALVDMYCKCGMIKEAEKIHDRTEEQTMVSWNSIISGFSLLKQSEDAHKFFSQMLENNVKPDNFTYASVLDACANLATVGLGMQIHAQIIKQELQSDVCICSTLVDMYSKCGNMQESRHMFDKASKKDFVTWNAMICGYAQHGLGEEALAIFESMQLENVKPNHATFISVLRACAHMGHIDKGLQYFDAMLMEYGLNPQLEHYSCMVDILGRSGQVDRALKLIQDMPFEADAVIWKNLLSICKIHGNVEIAEKATAAILKLDPQESSTCILLSNIYADAGMWDQVSEMRKMMRENKLKKEPGCSWIEAKDEVHTFLVRDERHPKCDEIYEKLGVLTDEMKQAGYVSDTDFVIDEEVLVQEQIEELIASV